MDHQLAAFVGLFATTLAALGVWMTMVSQINRKQSPPVPLLGQGPIKTIRPFLQHRSLYPDPSLRIAFVVLNITGVSLMAYSYFSR
jgi:hypothetical protein